MSNNLKYVRLCEDKDGESSFSESEIVLNAHPDTDQAFSSDGHHSEYTKFLKFPVGTIFDYHTAPCTQFIFLLQGRLEIEVSKGEKKLFIPGQMLLVEDISGKGHITRVIGDKDVFIAVCPILN